MVTNSLFFGVNCLGSRPTAVGVQVNPNQVTVDQFVIGEKTVSLERYIL